jgi:hypothetical protein
MAGRAGAREFEIGYLHDDVPLEDAGWYAHVQYQGLESSWSRWPEMPIRSQDCHMFHRPLARAFAVESNPHGPCGAHGLGPCVRLATAATGVAELTESMDLMGSRRYPAPVTVPLPTRETRATRPARPLRTPTESTRSRR